MAEALKGALLKVPCTRSLPSLNTVLVTSGVVQGCEANLSGFGQFFMARLNAGFHKPLKRKGGCLLTLLIVSFVVQKLLSFIRSHLLIFAFISNILVGGSCCDLCRRVFCLCSPLGVL